MNRMDPPVTTTRVRTHQIRRGYAITAVQSNAGEVISFLGRYEVNRITVDNHEGYTWEGAKSEGRCPFGWVIYGEWQEGQGWTLQVLSQTEFCTSFEEDPS